MDSIDLLFISSLILFIITGAFIAFSKLPKRTTWIISTFLIVTGFGSLYSYLFWLGPKYRHASLVCEITYYKSPKGNVILVQSETIITFRGNSGANSRLSVLDAETGKMLNTELVGYPSYQYHCLDLIVVTDDKIWYKSYDNGLHARDPYTGKIMLTEKQIIAKYPELQGVKKATVKTDDGYVFQSEPPDFRMKMISFPANKLNSSESWLRHYKEDHPYRIREMKTKDMNKMFINPDTSYTAMFWYNDIALLDAKNGICLKSNVKDDQEIKEMVHAHKSMNSSYEPDSSVNKDLQLRNPFIIENYLLHNPPSVLIAYDGFDRDRKIIFKMGRFDLKGRILWVLSQEQIGVRPNIYRLHNGTLYLAAGGKVVAINSTTGIVKWNVQL